jgi:hypothetical protein
MIIPIIGITGLTDIAKALIYNTSVAILNLHDTVRSTTTTTDSILLENQMKLLGTTFHDALLNNNVLERFDFE